MRSARLALLLVLSLVVGAVWVTVQSIRPPELSAVPTTPADGVRAQQKLYDLISQRRAPAHARGSVLLTEAELTVFLSHHLGQAAELPLKSTTVRLPGNGIVEFAGWIPLREILGEPPWSALADRLPAVWLDRTVWARLQARARLDGGEGTGRRRHLRLDVERFWLGRQRFPALMPRLLLSPETLRWLRWPVPDRVDALDVERGRVVIRTAG